MEEMILGVVALLIVLIPVAGLTLRFALKPVMDSVIPLMEKKSRDRDTEMLERRVTLLEQELTQVRRLAEGKDFDRELGREGRPASRGRIEGE